MQVQKMILYALVPWLFVCVSSDDDQSNENIVCERSDCPHGLQCKCYRGICRCKPRKTVTQTIIPSTTTTTTGYTTTTTNAPTKATSFTFSKGSSGGGPIANSTKQPSSSDSVVDQTQVDDIGLPASSIAGISAGVISIVIVAIVVMAILVCLRRRRKNDEKPSQPSVYDASRSNPHYDYVTTLNENVYDVQERDYNYADVWNNHREGKPETDVAHSQDEKVERKNTHPVYDTANAESEKEFHENDQNRVHKAHTNSITVSRDDEYSKVAKPTRYEDSTYDVTYSYDNNNSSDNAYDTTENRNQKVPRDTTYDVTYSGVKHDNIYDG